MNPTKRTRREAADGTYDSDIAKFAALNARQNNGVWAWDLKIARSKFNNGFVAPATTDTPITEMWSRNLRSLFRGYQLAQSFSNSSCNAVRATVMGASTPAGVVAARILKTSSYVDHVCLHDNETLVRATYCDLCDVDTACNVSVHVGAGDAKSALIGAEIVLVAVGRGGGGQITPAQTLADNLPLVRDVMCTIATFCPCATVVIASEPLNSMVPYAAEILIQLESFDPNRLLGSSCDSIRASTTLARITGLPSQHTSVVVVGGRSPCTAIPVFSQATPWNGFPEGIRDCIMDNMLSEARNLWCDQATSLASLPEGGYVVRGVAAAELVLKLARARCGSNESASAFVRSDLLPGHKFLMSEVELGPEGVAAILGLPKLNCDELRSLEEVLPILAQDVGRGIDAGRNLVGSLPQFA